MLSSIQQIRKFVNAPAGRQQKAAATASWRRTELKQN